MGTRAASEGPQLQAPVPPAGHPGAYAAEKSTFSSERASRFDAGLIPDTHFVYPPQRPSSASAAETFVKTVDKGSIPQTVVKGIYSHDPILDGNAEELWRFFTSNLKSPRMAVQVFGSHVVVVIDSHGNRSPRQVIDFSTQVDVSQYVNPQWQRVFSSPSRKASKGAVAPTVRETLEEYTRSKNPFKEFRLTKSVTWDFDEVTEMLTQLVRSTGYDTYVTVSFPLEDYQVVAKASNNVSKAAHSKAVQMLCFVSCLWLVFWPVWAISRKHMKNRLACEYAMQVSGKEFYDRNSGRISNAVMQRLKDNFMTAL